MRSKRSSSTRHKLERFHDLRKLTRNRTVNGGLWIFAGRAFFAGSALLINILLSRVLNTAAFGAYLMAFNIAFFGGVVGTLGLNQSIIRFLAEQREKGKQTWARKTALLSLKLAMIGAAGTGILYIFLQLTLLRGVLGSEIMASAALWTGLWIMLTVLQNVMAETFRGHGDVRQATLFSGVLSNFLMLAGLGLLMWLGRSSLSLEHALILVTVCMGISCFVAGWRLLKLLQGGFGNQTNEPAADHGPNARQLLAVSLPMMASNVALFMLTSSDIWILGVFYDESEVAIYGAAVRLMAVLNFFVVLMNTLMTSIISKYFGSGQFPSIQNAGRIIVGISTLPAIVIGMVFMLMGEQVLQLAFGSAYGSGYAILAVLSLGQLINLFAGPSGLLLTLTGHERAMLRITLITSVVTVIAAVAVVHAWGPFALAVVMVCGLLAQNGWMWVEVRRRLGISVHFHPVDLIRQLIRLAGRNKNIEQQVRLKGASYK